MLAAATAVAAGAPTQLEVNAYARASGNDRPAAVSLARILLAQPWAVQIVEVRVERAGTHRIAGITLSGVHLYRRVDPARFLAQANALADTALRTGGFEEADVWVVVPLDRKIGALTRDDFTRPAGRTVFTLTARRGAAEAREPFWDPAWRAELATRAIHR